MNRGDIQQLSVLTEALRGRNSHLDRYFIPSKKSWKTIKINISDDSGWLRWRRSVGIGIDLGGIFMIPTFLEDDEPVYKAYIPSLQNSADIDKFLKRGVELGAFKPDHNGGLLFVSEFGITKLLELLVEYGVTKEVVGMALSDYL
jgi:hypothetical protein